MTCQQLAHLASRFIDADLTADEMRAIRAHLDSCDDCRRYVEQIRQVARSLTRRENSIDDASARSYILDLLEQIARKDNG